LVFENQLFVGSVPSAALRDQNLLAAEVGKGFLSKQ